MISLLVSCGNYLNYQIGSVSVKENKAHFLTFIPVINCVFLSRKYNQLEQEREKLGTERCFTILKALRQQREIKEESDWRVSDFNNLLKRLNKSKLYAKIEDSPTIKERIKSIKTQREAYLESLKIDPETIQINQILKDAQESGDLKQVSGYRKKLEELGQLFAFGDFIMSVAVPILCVFIFPSATILLHLPFWNTARVVGSIACACLFSIPYLQHYECKVDFALKQH